MNVATVLGVVCNEKKTVGLGESFWKLGVSDFKKILEPTLILIMRMKKNRGFRGEFLEARGK